MSSFYGQGTSISNGSGNGTFNYDELLNKPIKNLRGIDSTPIVFSELEPGNYTFIGNYKFSQNDEEAKINNIPRVLQIYKDDIKNTLIAKFESFENGEYYVTSIIYNEDGTYTEEKYSPYQDFTEDITDMKEQVINITNNNITNALTIQEF